MTESIIYSHSRLFDNISRHDAGLLLNCLDAHMKTYSKGEFILSAGDTTHRLYFIEKGSVHIVKDDFWGNRTILSEASCGNIFGETYACLDSQPLEVSVVSCGDTTITSLDMRKIMDPCISSCGFHLTFIRNLITIMAARNLFLTQKIEHVTRRTTREKLLSYLSQESRRHGSRSFSIPFNRHEMADYLAVDRSAMSKELGKLRDEGILEFKKNSFTLHKLPE